MEERDKRREDKAKEAAEKAQRKERPVIVRESPPVQSPLAGPRENVYVFG